jgi:D-3-phosphoglycerate dehydrogenase / 2-oxoglutarate reductase
MQPTTSFPKSEIKILLLENVHPVAAEAFRAEGFHVETTKTALPEAELVDRCRDVHVLGIRSKTQVTPKVLDEAKRLLAVGAFCIGTNQVANAHANGRGVPVFNAPFSNTRSVAELIIAEVVMLSRHLGDRSREVHAGVWKKVAVGSHEVRGKTLGIVGYGHIGSQVGVLAEAMGMRVVFYDILAKLPMGNNRACGKLEEVLEVSDFVTLHVPETPSTKNMIGPAEIARMKTGACLLNASRGTVVVIEALAEGGWAGRRSTSIPTSPKRTAMASSPRSAACPTSSSRPTSAVRPRRPRRRSAARFRARS